jgi:hypothetical protein
LTTLEADSLSPWLADASVSELGSKVIAEALKLPLATLDEPLFQDRQLRVAQKSLKAAIEGYQMTAIHAQAQASQRPERPIENRQTRLPRQWVSAIRP